MVCPNCSSKKIYDRSRDPDVELDNFISTAADIGGNLLLTIPTPTSIGGGLGLKWLSKISRPERWECKKCGHKF